MDLRGNQPLRGPRRPRRPARHSMAAARAQTRRASQGALRGPLSRWVRRLQQPWHQGRRKGQLRCQLSRRCRKHHG
eukprot:14821541-Alexandrium_andersonii.AAC.1